MSVPRQPQTCTVSVREQWSEDWTAIDGLYCDRFTEAAGPDVTEALLKYNFGRVEGTDGVVADREPLEINGQYVRIELSQATEEDEEAARYWYGIVVDTTADRRGRLSSTFGDLISGQQVFHCRGLEFLLQRKQVSSSFVLGSTGEIEVGRAIGFNLGAGRPNDHVRHGNKSESPGERDAYIFADNIGVGGVVSEGAGTLWSVLDIITYLLHYQPPADVSGADQLNWTVPSGEDAVLLDKLYPTVAAEGKSLKDLLDEVIDRRRLVGWNIIVGGESERPTINVFTFNADAVALPGGATIPANANQVTWYFDDDNVIQSAILAEDDSPRFDVVIVRGAPLTGTFTVANTTGATPYADLIADWDSGLVTAYNDGASGATLYGTSLDTDRQALNQAFRADETFAKVFRSFIIDPAWDGTVPGDAPACPDPDYEDESGNPSTEHGSPFWYPGLRLLDWLPLRTDYDYETVADFPASSSTIDGSQPNYLRPFAVAKLGDVYYRLDRPGRGILQAELLRDGGITWAASVRMQDDCPGFFIDVMGAAQHVIAEADFTPADAADTADEEAPIDWKDIAVTICCEFDQHVEVKCPPEPLVSDADAIRELIINQPHYRLDYLAPDTVIGVDDEGALKTSDGGYVRDDRAIMQDLARCAYTWYGQQRKAMTIVRHDLVCDYSIGDLITSVGSEGDPITVNSVVTKIDFNVKDQTVTVSTAYAELDPRVA